MKLKSNSRLRPKKIFTSLQIMKTQVSNYLSELESIATQTIINQYIKLLERNLLEFHDAAKWRGVERVYKGLPFDDSELKHVVGVGRRNWRWVRERGVLPKRVDGASFGVFPNVVPPNAAHAPLLQVGVLHLPTLVFPIEQQHFFLLLRTLIRSPNLLPPIWFGFHNWRKELLHLI